MHRIAELRGQIDHLDRIIMNALVKRLEISRRIGQEKNLLAGPVK